MSAVRAATSSDFGHQEVIPSGVRADRENAGNRSKKASRGTLPSTRTQARTAVSHLSVTPRTPTCSLQIP
jgi:hypothetical protein